MISPFDDYCLHQTPDYLAVPGTTDRNFYDRYFFSGYRTDGSLLFGLAFGRYPNRFVQDAHLTLAVDGRQYSLHASDVLGQDPTETRVGPIAISVESPMRKLRCRTVGDSEGIRCDLLFSAETGAIDEGRLRVARKGMIYIDQTRFMQYGRWSGWIEVDGARHMLVPETAAGLRDKSWGVRAIGEQQVTARPGERIFWMNVVARFENSFCVFRTLDNADGSSHEREGYAAPVYAHPEEVPVGEPNLSPVEHWEFDLDFAPGCRRITRGNYRVHWPGQPVFELNGRCINTLYYAGMGYNHDRWHHGLDHGEVLVVEREEWSSTAPDPQASDRQFLASFMEYSRNGKIIGYGHTEQLLLGAYQPFGWHS